MVGLVLCDEEPGPQAAASVSPPALSLENMFCRVPPPHPPLAFTKQAGLVQIFKNVEVTFSNIQAAWLVVPSKLNIPSTQLSLPLPIMSCLRHNRIPGRGREGWGRNSIFLSTEPGPLLGPVTALSKDKNE